MFTGLVTDVGEIVAIEDVTPDLRRLHIASHYPAAGIALGASIACSGICLTVTAVEAKGDAKGEGSIFQAETAAETLARTMAREWRIGTKLNLERSLRIGDEMGGHLVSGHVDGVAQIAELVSLPPDPNEPWSATAKFIIDAPAELARFIAEKGSICLDGTSLTVNEVQGRRFSVLLIPHTLAVTTWGQRKAGDHLHIEVDLMARYAARLAAARAEGY
ncbi:MAG: riboflavin synthase [Bosea sp. (in: a-proteobacteria)]